MLTLIVAAVLTGSPVHAEPHGTLVRITSGSQSFSITAKDAKAIGKILATTDEHAERMKSGKRDTKEAYLAGDFTVGFRFENKAGFSVRITPNQSREDGFDLNMSQQQASEFAPVLIRASVLASKANRSLTLK